MCESFAGWQTLSDGTVSAGVGPVGNVPSAAEHAIRATLRTGVICQIPIRILSIPIAAPFPSVAEHIVKSPGVRFFLSNFMQRNVRITFMPSNRVKFAVALPGRTRHARVLPLSLSRKPIFKSGWSIPPVV